MTLPPLAALPTLALAVLAAGCAGTRPSVPVADGSRVLVRLYDASQGIELALANETHPGLQDLYSTERSDAALKLAPDGLMGELIASLDRAALADFAEAGTGTSEERGYLLVDQDGDRRVFPQPRKTDATERRQAWVRIKLLMDHYYQHVGGLQYVENPRGGALFQENG